MTEPVKQKYRTDTVIDSGGGDAELQAVLLPRPFKFPALDKLPLRALSSPTGPFIRKPSLFKGSLKNNFTFYTPMHLLRLRCESSEYPDIPAFSRLAE
jgi:hypothetical protein